MPNSPDIQRRCLRVRRQSESSLNTTRVSNSNIQQKRRESTSGAVNAKKKRKRNSYQHKTTQYIKPCDKIFHWSIREVDESSYLEEKGLRFSGAEIKLEEKRVELAVKTVLKEKADFVEKEFATLFLDDDSDDIDCSYHLSEDEDVADKAHLVNAKYVPLTFTTTGETKITVPPLKKPYKTETTKMKFVEPLTENVYCDDELQLSHFPQFGEFPDEDIDYEAINAFLHRTFPKGVHGNWRNKSETSEEMFYKTLIALLPGTKNIDLLHHALYETFPSYGGLKDIHETFDRLHKKYSNGKDNLEILKVLDSLKDSMKTKLLPYSKKFPFDVKYPDTRKNYIVRYIKIGEKECSENCYLNDYEVITRMEEFLEETDSKELKLYILKSTKRQFSDFLNMLLMRDDKGVVKNFCQTAKLFPNVSCSSWFKSLLDSASYADAMGFQQKSYANRMENFRHAQKEDKKKRREKNKGKDKKYEDYTTLCDHLGPCGPGVRNCPCKRFCTVFCNCDFNCNRKFPGCECPPGMCQTQQCPCFEIDFECSELTCRQCVEDDTLELSSCDNYEMTKGGLKKILVGKSKIAGNGAFLQEDVHEEEFLGEYVGERLSVEEGERRGIFHLLNISYTFGLAECGDVDAMRAGNVLRFLNNSDEPNCYIKYKYVKGDLRIGFYTLKAMKTGQELFINYRYRPEAAAMFFGVPPFDRLPRIRKYIPTKEEKKENQTQKPKK
ncbi:hypothetical protein L5515_004519 [Caenorhabditis briggsae]|uniref:Uncharacterized protein n=1 Tax=Caenorhabditis briggsae TaxID=6238 RepID=A0AAE9EHU5_CAEBR|nr:hypothetical protein L5515_004519 [Caenorhabditis briggsae]